MLQQKLPDPTGRRTHLWTSPMRDIAHWFPVAIAQASEFCKDQYNKEGASKEELKALEDYVHSWNVFVHSCTDGGNKTLGDVYEKSNFDTDSGTRAAKTFNKWFIRIIVGMYFKGIRHATHEGEIPYGVEHMAEALHNVQTVHRSEHTTWLGRQVRCVLNLIRTRRH